MFHLPFKSLSDIQMAALGVVEARTPRWSSAIREGLRDAHLAMAFRLFPCRLNRAKRNVKNVDMGLEPVGARFTTVRGRLCWFRAYRFAQWVMHG